MDDDSCGRLSYGCQFSLGRCSSSPQGREGPKFDDSGGPVSSECYQPYHWVEGPLLINKCAAFVFGCQGDLKAFSFAKVSAADAENNTVLIVNTASIWLDGQRVKDDLLAASFNHSLEPNWRCLHDDLDHLKSP